MVTTKILMIAYVLTVFAATLTYTNVAHSQVVEKGLVHYWSFDKFDNDIVPDLAGGTMSKSYAANHRSV